MKDMKQLINKWGESMLFSLLMALCLTWTFTACSDDKDNEYISDTQLSILEDNRTSLSYLLKTLPLEQRRELFRKPARRY